MHLIYEMIRKNIFVTCAALPLSMLISLLPWVFVCLRSIISMDIVSVLVVNSKNILSYQRVCS